MRIVLEFHPRSDPERLQQIADQLDGYGQGDWIPSGYSGARVESTEVVGSILNLRGLAGAKVARVDVADDSEVAIHTSGGTYRIRAEKERRAGVDPIEPVALVCKREALRP